MKNAHYEGLAELMGERWAELHRDRFTALKVDAVVPVPLHWRCRLKRGYNQSAALAYGLTSTLHLPLRRWWLRRIRNTPSQKALPATQRQENVKGAFRAWDSPQLRGAHVLLVDDVMTTGATANEAARALKARRGEAGDGGGAGAGRGIDPLHARRASEERRSQARRASEGSRRPSLARWGL